MQTQKHVVRWGVLGCCAAALLLGGVPVQAEDGKTAAKIAVINIGKTFDSYQRTIDSDKQLSAKGAKKEEEHAKMVEEVKKLREGLDLLSDKAKEERQKQLEEKVRRLQEFEQAVRAELQNERDSLARQILGEIDTALQEYAQKGAYDLIFNERVVVYGKASYDITNDFVQWLNQRYKP